MSDTADKPDKNGAALVDFDYNWFKTSASNSLFDKLPDFAFHASSGR